jgi:soluble lytic murein transglycosylase-like protein
MPPLRIQLRHRHAFGRRRAARRIALLLLSGFPLSVAPEAPTFAQPAPSIATPASNPYATQITEASQRFGIPERWIRAVLRAESAGDVHAISSSGAMGLMQVMPDTWAGLRVRYRLGRDPYEPRDNILAGTAYLREMFDRYGNVAAMLAAYNAGPARYDDHLATGRPLPPETRAYVSTLVPVLDGMAAADAPPPPLDWREAPLFVTRPTDARTAATPPSAAHSARTRASVPAHNPDDTEPETDSIFVARDSEGEAS